MLKTRELWYKQEDEDMIARPHVSPAAERIHISDQGRRYACKAVVNAKAREEVHSKMKEGRMLVERCVNVRSAVRYTSLSLFGSAEEICRV